MKGHENKKKNLFHFQSQIMAMGKNGERLERKKKCMPCVVARIYIVGSLVVLERGARVRRNCNIFNLAMENQLSRHHTQMHFKCTHFFNHFQIARS
jgi:hypothetical protein